MPSLILRLQFADTRFEIPCSRTAGECANSGRFRVFTSYARGRARIPRPEFASNSLFFPVDASKTAQALFAPRTEAPRSVLIMACRARNTSRTSVEREDRSSLARASVMAIFITCFALQRKRCGQADRTWPLQCAIARRRPEGAFAGACDAPLRPRVHARTRTGRSGCWDRP